MLDEDKSKDLYAKEIFSLVVLELWHREFVDYKDSPPPANDLQDPYGLETKPTS